MYIILYQQNDLYAATGLKDLLERESVTVENRCHMTPYILLIDADSMIEPSHEIQSTAINCEGAVVLIPIGSEKNPGMESAIDYLDRAAKRVCFVQMGYGEISERMRALVGERRVIPPNGNVTKAVLNFMEEGVSVAQSGWESYAMKFLSNQDGTCRITCGYDANSMILKLPSYSEDDESVTAIGERAFSADYVYSGSYPSDWAVKANPYMFAAKDSGYSLSVDPVGQMRFRTLTIPASVLTIETSAFSGLQWLRNLRFDLGSRLTYIGKAAFSDCRSIESIVFPRGLRRIEKSAFESCKLLREVNLTHARYMEYIGNSAFSECVSVQKVLIPYTVTEIGDGAFESCGHLESFEIVDPIWYKPHYGEKSQLKRIGNGAFQDCSRLREITIPVTVEEIGCDAFDGCALLDVIRLPRHLELDDDWGLPDTCAVEYYD